VSTLVLAPTLGVLAKVLNALFASVVNAAAGAATVWGAGFLGADFRFGALVFVGSPLPLSCAVETSSAGAMLAGDFSISGILGAAFAGVATGCSSSDIISSSS